MKKSLLTLLAVPLLLTGCMGGDDPADDPNSEEGSKKLTIRFHVDQTSSEGKGYKKIIDAFNTEHAAQGIKVTASYVARTGGSSAYEDQLRRDKEEGTLPDIITFDAPNCAAYANSGYLYDISSSLTAQEKSKFLALNTYGGKLYGIPIQESSAGFYYNKSIFAAAGVDVSDVTVDNPWTFQRFKEVCAQIAPHCTSKAVDMRLDATKDETATYLLYPFIYAAGGSFVSADGKTATGYFDSAKSIKGFQFLKDLVTSGYTSYGIGATDFVTGQCGMYLSSGWTIPELDNKYPAVFPNRDSWGLLPYPKDEIAASATGSWSYAITDNNRKDKTLVVELLKYITNPASSKTIVEHTGMIASNKDADVTYTAGTPEYVLRKQLELTGKERPVTVGYPQFSSAFSKAISEIRDGDATTVAHNKAQELQDALNMIK